MRGAGWEVVEEWPVVTLRVFGGQRSHFGGVLDTTTLPEEVEEEVTPESVRTPGVSPVTPLVPGTCDRVSVAVVKVGDRV